eukprot:14934846-Ditylum_brightwellii.AAC.1
MDQQFIGAFSKQICIHFCGNKEGNVEMLKGELEELYNVPVLELEIRMESAPTYGTGCVNR